LSDIVALSPLFSVKSKKQATQAARIQQGIHAYTSSLFRKGWGGRLRFNWQLGVILILLFGVPRFFIVMRASMSGDYRWVSVIFVAMMLVPFFILAREGRQHIGMKRPASWRWMGYSFLLGTLICLFTYTIGNLLFGHDISNWFVYIARTFPIPAGELADNRFLYFVILAIPGMIFSPIGEEILYRGMIHTSFAMQTDDNVASRIDSIAFAVTHLAHFGLIWTGTGWRFLPLPAILWMVCMFLASRVFYFCRVKTDSLAGAMVAHAAFNLTMTFCIVYGIL
jgi:membrane protease YdiL (CAAX protease family)